MASTVVDVIVVGLAAIASDVELDCKVMATGPAAASELHVLMLDPGWPMTHTPYLGVRADALATLPTTCYKDDLNTVEMNCGVSPEQKWARYEMRGRELRIDQPVANSASVFTGQRKVATCWQGMEPGTMACVANDLACKRDASWVPEYSKVVDAGVIDPQFLEAPEEHAFISAVSRGLRGQLEAGHRTGPAWNWMWSHPSCAMPAKVPDYTQKFASRAIVQNVTSSTTTIRLVELEGFGSTAIELKAGMTADASAEVMMLSSAPAHWMKIEGDKCLIPHFEAHHQLLEDPTDCRRIPYFVTGGKCEDGFGAADPVCPPVHMRFNRGGP